MGVKPVKKEGGDGLDADVANAANVLVARRRLQTLSSTDANRRRRCRR